RTVFKFTLLGAPCGRGVSPSADGDEGSSAPSTPAREQSPLDPILLRVWVYQLVQPAVKPKCFPALHKSKAEIRRPR
ncbi:MAG: hypothetical protein IKP47_00150, partial [Ruminococcus sp.]|nr:hypothetical protein [Ruminococcus sp.]